MEIKQSMNKYFFAIVTTFSLIVSACSTDTEDPNADLTRDMRAIDAYLQGSGVPSSRVLSDNNSGVRFVFDSYGKGIAPTSGQTVTYDVIGSVLSNGTVGAPFINTKEVKKIEDVTPEGLQYALRSVLKGTDVTVYIPARFGYGTSGNNTLGVPADAILKYDLFVNEVARTVAQQNQFQQDTAAIKDFLEANNIADAVEHESGIWYKVEEQGSGAVPNPYHAVTFDYELRTLANAGGSAIETNTLTDRFIWELVQGLRIGFQLMNEGSTYTFYLPSGMCYGTNAQPSIPANSNLVFKIKLKSIRS
jgi:FKBP-type peptidyl-prolyl cis-trans isomerase FkpA